MTHFDVQKSNFKWTSEEAADFRIDGGVIAFYDADSQFIVAYGSGAWNQVRKSRD